MRAQQMRVVQGCYIAGQSDMYFTSLLMIHRKKSDQSGLDLAALSPQTGWHGGFKSRLALVAAISHANSSAITKEEKNRMKRGIHE